MPKPWSPARPAAAILAASGKGLRSLPRSGLASPAVVQHGASRSTSTAAVSPTHLCGPLPRERGLIPEMSAQGGSYDKALARAAEHARTWLDSVGDRPVGPRASADELLAGFGGPLPQQPTPPEDVVDLLAKLAEPGLMAMQSGRFFGWVIGGTLPAALAADWLVSAWDQNTGLRYATPASAAAEEAGGALFVGLLWPPA